ncbi:MAG: DNA polymerase III subunit beta [Lachnospiraceae bacterium]|nr:DNA polymerase III subunit beta [Lachnospiraceae bacterium]
MKIVCSKSKLSTAISIVLKAVSTKTTMPILECILIEAQGDIIKLTANDMELGIETILEGEVIEPGRIALEAKLLSDIVRKLADNNVTIETNDKYETLIRCEKSKFKIAGKEGSDFTELPEIEKNNFITVSQFTLKEVIRQTIFSTSDNENNILMTGELFEINEDKLKVVSLDGHRISIRNINLSQNYGFNKVIVPAKTLSEISKILTGEIQDEVKIYFTSKHILFEFDQTKVLSRVLEGEYYKISQMLSNDYETKIDINKKEFLECIDRSTLLIKESDKKPIILNITSDNIELKINSTMGSLKEDVEIKKEGKDIMIGFNPRFLMDALKVIDDETLSIYMVNPKAPCVIKDQKETYIYLILPVNFNI